MNGFVLYLSGLVASVAHSATVVSNGSGGTRDFDFDFKSKAGALLVVGELFFTRSVSHWSAFGRGLTVSMGTTFCGDARGVTDVVLCVSNVGDSVLGAISATLIDELFDDETDA